MKEEMTLEEWNRERGGGAMPIILSEAHLEIFNKQIPAEKIQALREDKVVYIEGFWTVLSKHLLAVTNPI